MHRRKARRKKSVNASMRDNSSRRRVIIISGITLSLLLTGVLMARWHSRSAASSQTAMTPTSLAALPAATPNPFVPKRAAKEYIYVGGHLQAIEEPAPTISGTMFDFNGNGSGDVVIWRPADGNWYVLDLMTNTNSLQQLGAPSDMLVPGDYDGDSRTDIAVWRPNTGTCSNNCGWYIKQSSTGTVAQQADWGQSGDVPVPTDYDGDGRTDKAVWRPSEGNWYVINSQTNSISVQHWRQAGDRPVPADYDGDGRAEMAVFRPSEGNWYVKQSTGGTLALGWGLSTDVLAPADYDGDGRADLAVWRAAEGTWYLRLSTSGAVKLISWGQAGDRIMPADYDGDGRTDIAVWRPSDGNWYIQRSSDGLTWMRNWGQAGDQPVPAAFVRQP